MKFVHPFHSARRTFLGHAAGLASAACLGLPRRATAADPPPEITKIRLLHIPAICHAPQYLAEEMLKLEGITEVEYVRHGTRFIPDALATSKADMSMWNAMDFIPLMDANKPVVVLAGIHAGCFELFGNERVRSIRDLKGKTVAVTYLFGGDHILLSSMLPTWGSIQTKSTGCPVRLLCSMQWMLSAKVKPTPSWASPSSLWRCARNGSGM